MKETYFFRDLENLESLKIKTNEKLTKNLIKDKYSIISTVKLNQMEFEKFCFEFKHNYKFLYKYIEKMYVDKNGIWNCIEIKCKDEKILVQNNGYSYPRFTGLVL